MKELIRKILKEETENILELPHIKYFFDDWNEVIKYVKEEGNPLFSMQGNLDLRNVCPKTLGRLYSVEGYLDLYGCEILTSLGNLTHVKRGLDLRGTNITSLGNLQHVGGYLDLYECKNLTSLGNLTHVGGWLDLRHTKITSLGNLQHVGGDLLLKNTPIAKKYSKQKIRKMIKVEGDIYL